MTATHSDLILGTAGHIDHGKSALVRALTGTDPDRLAEEKQRGITIQLGFARLELPDGRSMGVVDVPGHEKFVRQMIAGATGVDVALLVIAADDGVMPQTIEHIAVLQTLGVRSCVVALTKADLVDDDWIEFVADDVRARLAATPFDGAPIVAVSSKTGSGLDELRQAIQGVCDAAGAAGHGDVMRLPVDRAFTIKGAGTVVTGTLWGGTIAPGDVVEILPGRATSRVRGVQIHGHDADVAYPGNRVAVNLADVSVDEVASGDMLAAPGEVDLTDRFDCRVAHLDTTGTGKPLASGCRMHIAHGTREVLGRVLFCGGVRELAAGEEALAQVRLEEQLAVRHGDRFIMRSYSPVHVAGGGTVLLSRPRRRTNLKEGEVELFESLGEGDVRQAAVRAVALQPFPVSAARIASYVGEAEPVLSEALESAAAAGDVLAIGSGANRLFTTAAVRQRLLAKVDRALVEFHSAHTAEPGMNAEALRRTCFPQLESAAFGALIDDAARSGVVIARGGLVGHPSAQGSAAQALGNAADALSNLLAKQGMSPEPLNYLAEHAGVAPELTGKAVAALLDEGRVYRVSPELLFDAATVDAAKQAVAAHLRAGGAGTVAALRDVMGTSRKYAVPLLERFDAEKFTKRNGDERTLY